MYCDDFKESKGGAPQRGAGSVESPFEDPRKGFQGRVDRIYNGYGKYHQERFPMCLQFLVGRRVELESVDG